MEESPLRIPGRIPALIGGIWGVACAALMGGLRIALGRPPQPNEELLGDVAFLAAYLAPFAVALAATRWHSPALRAAVWLASGLLAVPAAFTAFSGVSLIFLPALPLLALAALRAISAARLGPGLAAIGVAGVLIAVSVGAFLVLFAREDPRCWDHVRTADGRLVWQSAPFSYSRSLPADATGPVASVCTSNIISPMEGLLSLALLAAGWVGIPVLWRRLTRPASHPEG